MNWIEIFRTGSHTDSAGHTRDFSAADLDRMVASLDPKRHEPPLVLGHPKTDAPAWGWVRALRRQGEVLQAAFRDVPPVIRELVAKGRYKKRSIAVYPDGRLRHVGLLGAATPAVQGLKDIAAFAADDDAEYLEFTEGSVGAGSADRPSSEEESAAQDVRLGLSRPERAGCKPEFTSGEATSAIGRVRAGSADRPSSKKERTYMDPEELKRRVQALEAENALLRAKADGADAGKIAELEAKLKELTAGKEKAEAEKAQTEAAFAEMQKNVARKELEGKVESLVTAGKLLPKDKAAALAFAEALASGGEREFAEGQGKKPLQAHFFDFLTRLPGHGLEGEFAAASGNRDTAAIPYHEIMNKV